MAKQYLEENDKNKDGSLDFGEFVEMCLKLFAIKEISDFKVKSVTEFQNFLKNQQKEVVSEQECKRLFEKYNPEKETSGIWLNYFIVSEDNSVMNPKLAQVYQNMDEPLTHYFIDSSHNTYLSGHQLKGESSIEMYASALRRGCRCVELDVWDGETEPMIKHGYTLTTKINLRDVCEVIAENAFIASSYPLILSIENHTSKAQQSIMADIFTATFGSSLASPSQYLNNRNSLPSPNELKNKILLKGTMFSSNLVDPEEFEEQKEKLEKTGGENHKEERGMLSKSTKLTNLKDLKIDTNHSFEMEMPTEKKIEVITSKLAELIFLKSSGFKGFNVSTNNKFYEMCSFSEGIIEKEQFNEHIKYNENHLSRIYPKGTRFDSSNYYPIPHWNCNSQIVALNYQTCSNPMILNRGKFRENGKTGFVLQPSYHKYDFSYKLLKVKVMRAIHLPRTGETSDPFIAISIHGESDKQRYKTKVVDNNGFNPCWDETTQFKITNPLSILLFKVKDKDVIGSKNIVHYAIPIHCIRQGIRAIHLEDNLDNKKNHGATVLLCHFEFN